MIKAEIQLVIMGFDQTACMAIHPGSIESPPQACKGDVEVIVKVTVNQRESHYHLVVCNCTNPVTAPRHGSMTSVWPLYDLFVTSLWHWARLEAKTMHKCIISAWNPALHYVSLTCYVTSNT